MKKVLNAVLMMAGIFSASIVAQAGKPVKEEPLFVEYGPPPRDVAGMTSAADAVIIAEYSGQARQVEKSGFVWTIYKFRILEILKLHRELPPVWSDVELELVGGDLEFPTFIRRSKDDETSELQNNSKYVLFLGWNLTQAKLQFAWGPSSIYEITNGRVKPLRTTWNAHDRKEAAVFLKEVRSTK